MALASVIGKPIKVVYPDIPSSIRIKRTVIGKPIKVVYPDIPSSICIKRTLHCVLYPREVSASELSQHDLVCVMWTRTNRSALHGWQRNHFVSLVGKKSNMNIGRQSYADVLETGRSVLWRVTSGFSTSPPTAKSHNRHSPKSKVQTKPEDEGTSTGYEKNFHHQLQYVPPKLQPKQNHSSQQPQN